MNFISLFAGIGGFDLGLERAGMKCVAQVEIDDFCQRVLTKHWPNVPKFRDVRDFGRDSIDGTVDLICGGFPCQPFSVAGKREGEKDDRHLWPEYLRIIKQFRPRWVLGENVAGIINMALDQVLSDLEGENYTCRAFVIPACAVNAPHRRDRVWIVGYAEHDGQFAAKVSGGTSQRGHGHAQRAKQTSEPAGSDSEFSSLAYAKKRNIGNERKNGETSANSPSPRLEGGVRSQSQGIRNRFADRSKSIPEQWAVEPSVGRVANGVPNRSHRIKSLGNAVVPQVVEVLGRAIMCADSA